MNQQATSVQVCRVLDMDTIAQAKDKILEYLYKVNSNLRPSSVHVDLELCLILLNSQNNSIDTNTLGSQANQHSTTLITLKETEEELIGTSNIDLQMPKRLLTLRDYNIQNGSFINVCFKQSYTQLQQCQNSGHVYMSTLSIGNEYQIYAGNERVDKKTACPPMLPPSLQANRYHIVKPQQGMYN